MTDFMHSILRTNSLVAADGDITYDLPVNPLSAILIHLSPLNETAAIADYAFFAGLLSALDNVRVTHKGSALVDLNGYDLAMLALLYHNVSIWQSNAVETNDDRRSMVIPIFFGRHPYMRSECFPKSSKGELQMTVTWDIDDTGFDGLRVSIETIELFDATPDWVQKVTTNAQTFAATGQNDVELPQGNAIRALLLHGTTSFAGAAPAPSWGQLEVMVDNRQVGYSATDWEVSRAIAGFRGADFPPSFQHVHSVDAAGVGREDTLQPEIGLSKDAYYTLLDFDPLRDDSFVLETAGVGRVHVRCDAETADAVRVLPIERVPSSVFLEA
jgi:hypothetical protein